MRKLTITMLLALLASVTTARADEPELKTDDDKTLYAIGLAISQNLGPFNLSEAELKLVQAGIADGALNREKKVDLETYGPKIGALQQSRAKVVAEGEKKKSEEFLTKAAAEKGAKKTASGLIYTETKAGTGTAPKATDQVKVHYTGTLPDGTKFDSSRDRGQPATFPLNGVIPCWTEGVQLMKVGGTGKLICPSDLAYGDRGAPPKIKPGQALVFDVELIEIVKAPAAAAKGADKPAADKPAADKPAADKPVEE
jgi:FKBP-type peptidyl-prolyl cis-trans isomerase FkpA/FKBP-type peptidyl-prolyl cis-trans isomerase FklB